MLDEFLQILPGTIMITGLVIIMMMLIECINVWTRGRFVSGIKASGTLQIVICTLLGAVPGCMGGFAVVSMFSHGMVSFGSLIAMMIASSGDEAFVMLALIPRQALFITLGLSVLAVIVGLLIDRLKLGNNEITCGSGSYSRHEEEGNDGRRHFGWKRIALLAGVGVFLFALVSGGFEEGGHSEEAGPEFLLGGINLLSEDWMNVMFAVFAVSVIVMILCSGDHFVEEHLWHHVVCGHLPRIFLWTAGTLVIITLLLHFVDISRWVSDNVILMILIAALVGIIPESGPHMIFVTLFAAGIVPLPVLIASCISQDGHSGLPLLAEDRKSFIIAKAVNVTVAVAVGLTMLLF